VVRRLYANVWFRYAVTAALLLLVALKVHPERVAQAISSAHAGYVAAALLLTIPFLYCKAARWFLMLRAAGIEATGREAAVSLLGGMGLALLTPARLGELIRVAYIRDPRKLKIGGLVMLDKGFDVLVLAGLSVPGAYTLLGPPAGIALLLVTVSGLFAVYNPRPIHRSLHSASARLPMGEKLTRVWESLESLSPVSTTQFLLLTLASFVLVLGQSAILLLSWHSWAPHIVLLTFPLVILTNVVPVTIGGLGVREGAAAFLLSRYGVSSADAALTAFLMFALNTALPGLVGAFLLPAAPRGNPATAAPDAP
jgi:uncharacterized membrane protein YbhN (UPF0104 family)